MNFDFEISRVDSICVNKMTLSVNFHVRVRPNVTDECTDMGSTIRSSTSGITEQ